MTATSKKEKDVQLDGKKIRSSLYWLNVSVNNHYQAKKCLIISDNRPYTVWANNGRKGLYQIKRLCAALLTFQCDMLNGK